MSQTDDSAPNSKVARVIQKYDLEGLGSELEDLWTREDDRYSLRDLATEFNRRVLHAALRNAGQSVTRHDVEHLHSVLTDQDVSEGARIQKRRELERDGVDVEAVEQDFVTHQTIHTYLREFRKAEHESSSMDPVDRARQTIERLRSRSEAVTEQTVERLTEKGHLTAGDLETYVEIRVHCEECGTDQDVASFLDGGGCECSSA
ncbi:MAG: rod-determining factor RdfA [Halanaeroarchaeum sp.]